MIDSNSDSSHRNSQRPRLAIIRAMLFAALATVLIVAGLMFIPFITFGKPGSTPPLVPTLSGTSIQIRTVTVEHEVGQLADASRVAALLSTNESMKRGAAEHASSFVMNACASEFEEGGSLAYRQGTELELVSTGWPFRSFATRTLNDLSCLPQIATPLAVTQRYEVRTSSNDQWASSVDAKPDERVEWRAVLETSIVRTVLASKQQTPYISWRNTALNFLVFWCAIATIFLSWTLALRSRRRRNGLCIECGYGPRLPTQSTCPECGCAYAVQTSPT